MSMSFRARLLAVAVAATIAPAYADEPQTLPEITVFGNRPLIPLAGSTLEPQLGDSAGATDAAELLDTTPGAAVVRNGAQTGIVQLRGLFNDRVNIRVNGAAITPACPNHMDPPLHYVTAAGLDSLQVTPGVTPVSEGGDSIAGTVIARSAPPQFGADDSFTSFGLVGAGYNGSHRGGDGRLTIGTANNDVSVQYAGERLSGQNQILPDGEVRDSGYNIAKQDAAIAARLGGGVLRIDAGHHDTWDTGTPALPMDIIYDRADRGGISFEQENGLEARLTWHSIEHLMDNYSLRPLTGAFRMAAPTTSEDIGARIGTTIRRGDHSVRAGVESYWNDFNGYQQNMDTSALQDMFRNAERDRLGAYGEWQQDWNSDWRSLAGLRYDRVESDADDVIQFLPASAALAAMFNAAEHNIVDDNWEWMVQTRFTASAAQAYELSLARKMRSPSLLERYLWNPSNASAGQADGRTYIGNLNLVPEESHQINLGAAWSGANWKLTPNLFYNVVHDYIQGTPDLSLPLVMGQPVLRYTNIGRAQLYGLDGGWQVKLSDAWALRGTVSYVRGTNEDNGDNLYRIAPLHGDINVDYTVGAWLNTVEWRLAARQNRVAAYNGETETPGYGIVHLRTRWQATKSATLTAGVENLLDREYADHLSGVNRVTGSDVAVGERIPGAGRAFYLAGEYRW